MLKANQKYREAAVVYFTTSRFLCKVITTFREINFLLSRYDEIQLLVDTIYKLTRILDEEQKYRM